MQRTILVTVLSILRGAKGSEGSALGNWSFDNSAEPKELKNGELVNWPLKGQLLLFGGNPTTTHRGEELVEGDIVVPGSDDAEHKKATVFRLRTWPRATVYYTFHYSVDDYTRQVIFNGLQHWEEMTCIKFRRRTSQMYYIRFRSDTPGCWSTLGRRFLPWVGQDLSLGNRCNQEYVVVHEVGHALGFNHEQARRDRDEQVKVLWQNVALGGFSQFWRGLDDPYGVEYDLTSIMHYHPMAFSRRVYEKNTVVSINPFHQWLIGRHKNGLSFRDAKLANIVYRCNAGCPNIAMRCQNGGYLSPFRGGLQPCHCICPPGTSGEQCEIVTGDYYDDIPCGGEVRSEGFIETPNYPNRTAANESCAWWIKAPGGKEVEVEFEDFSFTPRYNSTYSLYYDRCVQEHVEIRTTGIYDGDIYCGTDIEPGRKFKSSGGNLLILISADDKMEGRGLRANVRFL